MCARRCWGISFVSVVDCCGRILSWAEFRIGRNDSHLKSLVLQQDWIPDKPKRSSGRETKSDSNFKQESEINPSQRTDQWIAWNRYVKRGEKSWNVEVWKEVLGFDHKIQPKPGNWLHFCPAYRESKQTDTESELCKDLSLLLRSKTASVSDEYPET